MMISFMLGFILSSAIAITAYYKQALNVSGATSAIIVGTIIYALGSPFLFMVLISFFLSATIIGLFGSTTIPANRNAFQVLANSLLATVFVVLFSFTDEVIYLILFFTSIGVAASDTWSSEIGRLSKKNPYHIFKWRKMDQGLSGAVSFIGLLGAIIAALLYAGLAMIVIEDMTLIYLIAGFSFLGSIVDSMFGIAQVKFKDKVSGKVVDMASSTTIYHSGLKFLTNNGVNFLANATTVFIIYLTIR